MNMLEFVMPAISIKAILPQIILATTAMVVLLIDVFAVKGKKSHLGYLSLVGVAVAVISTFYCSGMRETAYSGMVLVDGFSIFITLVICVVVTLVILMSIHYQTFFSELNSGEYYSLILFAACGMVFMGSSANLLMVFIALETMSIPIYVLAGFQTNREKSIESAMKYFILGAFATGFLLYGFAMIYGATGTLDILKIGQFLKANPAVLHHPFLVAGIALMTVGFGFKVAMVPFHMWTPDVYQGAPTSVTAFMAAGVKTAGFAALIRVYFVALGPLQVDWVPIMWVIAVLTMTIGNIVAIVQNDIKRMLAYSSIAHAGYLLVGFVVGTDLARAGMLYYLLGYAFMNIGAFAVIALLGKKGHDYTEMSDFAGLGFKYPVMGLVMSVFIFSMAGIPPTAGFMGKFYIFSAAIESGYIWLAILGIINSIISIYYYLRVLITMYFQEATQDVVMPAPSPAIVIALILSCVGVLLMGLLPASFWKMAQDSAAMLI